MAGSRTIFNHIGVYCVYVQLNYSKVLKNVFLFVFVRVGWIGQKSKLNLNKNAQQQQDLFKSKQGVVQINQSNFICFADYINKLSSAHMILELKKACLDAIDRALSNLNLIKVQWSNSFPKPAQQKLHSVQNDVQLLKDNFTLIATKVLRLESKCNEKESMALKVENKYRGKFEEASEAYKILEVKHEKMGKQLSFIKFSNNCLRTELQSLQNKQSANQRLSNAILDIQKLVSSNGENLQNNINKIIASIQKQDVESIPIIQKSFGFDFNISKSQIQHLDSNHKVNQFNLEPPLIPQLQVLKEQKQIINSCQLKTDRDHLKTKKKLQLGKECSESKQTVSTQKKKRNELAKLVQQQGRLSRINQRYLSTDII